MSQPEAKPNAAMVAEPLPRAFHVGDRIGRVMVSKFIASGGMGELYKGWDVDLKRPVAIKTLLPPPAAFADAAPLFLIRFRDEAAAVAGLDNDNVIRVYHFGETESGRPYMVMPFLDGEDLATRIRRARTLQCPLAVHEALEIILGACRGVDACHRACVIHRDLKPGNIFLTKDQARGRMVVKVLDFGVAQPSRRDNDEATFRGLMMGTPAYMAPEQAMGMDVDVRSDEYALAAMLYLCLTLHTPYDYAEAGLTDDKEKAAALLRAIRSGTRCCTPGTYTPDLPKGLEAAIVRALSPDPADRYNDAYEFARAIVPFASEQVRGYYGDYFRNPPLAIVMPQLSIPMAADGWPRLPFQSSRPLPPPRPNSIPTISDKRPSLQPSDSTPGQSLADLVRSALSRSTSPGTPVNERSTAVTPPDADLLQLGQQPPATEEGSGEPLTEVRAPELDLLGLQVPPPPSSPLDDLEAPTLVSPLDFDFLGVQPPTVPSDNAREQGIPVLRTARDLHQPIVFRTATSPWKDVVAAASTPAAGNLAEVYASVKVAPSDANASAPMPGPSRTRLSVVVVAIFVATFTVTLTGALTFQRLWRRPGTPPSPAALPTFLRAELAPQAVPTLPPIIHQQPYPTPVQSMVTPSATSSSHSPTYSPPPAAAPPPSPIEKQRRHVVYQPMAERHDERQILIPGPDPLPRRPPWWKSWHLDQYGHKIATDKRGKMWRLDEKTGRPQIIVDDQGIPILMN